jgi:hypothetical protein
VKKALPWIFVGVAALVVVWLITQRQQTPNAYAVDVVPTAAPLQGNATSPASPSARECLSEQCNIVGEHPNSQIENGTVTTWIGKADPSNPEWQPYPMPRGEQYTAVPYYPYPSVSPGFPTPLYA